MARRVTERAGAAYVAVQDAEVERIERELPEPPLASAMQLVSVEGEWGEVRTLVIGEVLPPQTE
jgi:hypothetical protein